MNRTGTTLVELLVVVAVISIIAAIGVVNLLHAQERAKLAVVANDLRLLSNGLAAYHVDHNHFPPGPRTEGVEEYRRLFVPVALSPLTTPLAYMSSLMSTDPFGGERSLAPGAFQSFDTVIRHAYVYVHYPDFSIYKSNPALNRRGYGLTSFGPDLVDTYGVYRPFPTELSQEAVDIGIHTVADTVFDPTNGVMSRGDISRFGGSLDTFPML